MNGGGGPLVSVIIPAFNAAATVTAAIESALGQTLSDTEVIVVDDGSTDDTTALVSAIDDSRLRVLRGEHGGVARARNRGLRSAGGRFITFLDADDMWTAEKLTAQVDALERDPSAGAVYSWTAFFDQNGRYLFAKGPQYHCGDVYAELLATYFLASGSNVLARRECIEATGEFDEAAEPVEDWEYWLRAAKVCRFAVTPNYHVLYRFSTGSASSEVERYGRAVERVVEKEFAQATPGLRARYAECLSNAKQHACLLHLARTAAPDAHRKAGLLLRSAIAQRPTALFSMRVLTLLCAWLALGFASDREVNRRTESLLRQYGRWMMLRAPVLRSIKPARRRENAVPCASE